MCPTLKALQLSTLALGVGNWQSSSCLDSFGQKSKITKVFQSIEILRHQTRSGVLREQLVSDDFGSDSQHDKVQIVFCAQGTGRRDGPKSPSHCYSGDNNEGSYVKSACCSRGKRCW